MTHSLEAAWVFVCFHGPKAWLISPPLAEATAGRAVFCQPPGVQSRGDSWRVDVARTVCDPALSSWRIRMPSYCPGDRSQSSSRHGQDEAGSRCPTATRQFGRNLVWRDRRPADRGWIHSTRVGCQRQVRRRWSLQRELMPDFSDQKISPGDQLSPTAASHSEPACGSLSSVQQRPIKDPWQRRRVLICETLEFLNKLLIGHRVFNTAGRMCYVALAHSSVVERHAHKGPVHRQVFARFGNNPPAQRHDGCVAHRIVAEFVFVIGRRAQCNRCGMIHTKFGLQSRARFLLCRQLEDDGIHLKINARHV